MCCRNGPRRQPLVVTLGQYAYKKYQNRKQNQQALAAGPSNHNTLAPPQVREHNATNEILEKSAIAPPPSYDTVVSGKPKTTTGDGKKHDVDVIADDRDDLSDAESLSDGQGSAEMEAAQADFIANWRASRGGEEIVVGRESKPLTKCQRRRAECAIRDAERAARRADRAVMGK